MLEMLQWTDMEYSNFLLECGMAYLHFYLPPADDWGRKMLQSSKTFWSWWRSQWSQRDNDFVCQFSEGLAVNDSGDLQECYTVENLRIIYQHVNNPATLASDIYPNRVVLDESYNQMICELIKEELHA